MSHTNTAVRVAGTWLAIASLLLIAALLVHGPLAPSLGDQMIDIAGRATAWSVIHWVSAASLSLYSVTGLIVLTSGSRLAADGWTMTAWAVLTVSALWTMTTAVVEATVVTNAAVAGDRETFEAWWAFAEGKASGIAFFALAVAVISGNEAQSSERAVPTWSAWIAKRIRLDRESEASHDLNRLLDKPGFGVGGGGLKTAFRWAGAAADGQRVTGALGGPSVRRSGRAGGEKAEFSR
jgi:hypothetical protein